MGHGQSSQTQHADQRFIKNSMRTPMLCREREADLAARWREHDDTEALHELVRAHTRLVIATAGRFRNYGLPVGDLVQEGNLGLMQAASRFEPERGVRFSTYAAWWVRSSMQDYVLRNWSIVRTGTTAAQKILFFNLRRLRTRIDPSGGPLSPEGVRRIAEELGVEVAEVEGMEQRLSAADQSLNGPISFDSDEQRQDFIPDQRPSPEEIVIGTRDGRTRSRWLAAALAELSPRERLIIDQRRLQEESATLETLGRHLGVSKERVRQLEHRAILKLRALIDRNQPAASLGQAGR